MDEKFELVPPGIMRDSSSNSKFTSPGPEIILKKVAFPYFFLFKANRFALPKIKISESDHTHYLHS